MITDTEAKKQMVTLIAETILAYEKGQYDRIGKGFTEMYDLLTDGKYSKLMIARSHAFREKSSEDINKIDRDLDDTIGSLRHSFPAVLEAKNFLNNWMDSKNHEWGYGDKNSWIPEARKFVKQLTKT